MAVVCLSKTVVSVYMRLQSKRRISTFSLPRENSPNEYINYYLVRKCSETGILRDIQGVCSLTVLLTHKLLMTLPSAVNIPSQSGILIPVMPSQETCLTLGSRTHRTLYFPETFLSDITAVWQETKVSRING